MTWFCLKRFFILLSLLAINTAAACFMNGVHLSLVGD